MQSPARGTDGCSGSIRADHHNDRSPRDDNPGFVGEEPEHCHDWQRLIRPGETYFLTIGRAALCQDCARTVQAIRRSGGLTVEVREDRLLVRRGIAVVEVLAAEVRNLVDALVEAAESSAPCAITHGQYCPW